ncbi:MAG: translation initiation factor 2 [Rhizobiaceae bacterium]
MKKLVIAALCALATGCASLTRGTSEVVEIQVVPADATVTTSLGFSCAAMPCRFKVDRKAEFTVTATKDGFQQQTVNVSTKVSGGGAAGFAGNVIAGGVVGMGVDAATGATLDHYPNPVVINLIPLEGAVMPVAPMAPAAPLPAKAGLPVS